MQIIDLRQINSRKLQPLLEEEARCWLEELRWDYRPSIQLIQSFIDSRTLTGYAALEGGRPAGYGFYVLEEHKGLIGGLFVSPSRGAGQAEIGRMLLWEMLSTLRGIPGLARVEAQLIPFGTTVDSALEAEHFRLYGRLFMLLDLTQPGPAALPVSAAGPGARLERWPAAAGFFEPCARLIQLAYANHVDAEINDQYRSEAGAMKFLRNVILLRGCGQFVAGASFVLRSPDSDRPAGVVLTSEVSPAVGHTTQVCLLPGYQGHGLGRHLMEASIQALRGLGFRALSLTVTSSNGPAVRLYERLGFRTIKRFSAAVWEA